MARFCSLSLLLDVMLCALVVIVIFSFAMFTIVLGDTDVPLSGNGAPVPIGGAGAFDPSAEFRSRALAQSKKRLTRALPQTDSYSKDIYDGKEGQNGVGRGGFFGSLFTYFSGRKGGGQRQTSQQTSLLSAQRNTQSINGIIYPQQFRPVISATPSASFGAELHKGPPKPLFWDTRNCECLQDWETFRKDPANDKKSVCSCGGKECPPQVDPEFLTEARGQGVCSLRESTGYGCTVGCDGDKVSWYGHNCNADGTGGMQKCHPLVITPSATPTVSKSPPPPILIPQVSWDPSTVITLHGLRCEFLDGVERCFTEDTQGRTLCPEYVTSSYLQNPPTSGEGGVTQDIKTICFEKQYVQQYYCSVFCQDGNNRVQWWTHDVNWCYSKDGKGACPSRHPVFEKSKFEIVPWTEAVEPDRPCLAAHKAGVKPSGTLKGLTAGMLTHEPIAFGRTLETYENFGFFDVIDEFLIYMNQRSPGLENIVRPYQEKHGFDKIKILGDPTNVGIARGIVYLTGNASNPYFMLLERDFWLIEPNTCVEEQLSAGLELLKTKKVHVVRYRSQKHAGRPNWAENFFLGHEDDAFVGRQPNLACNIHYWIYNASKIWPDRFWVCGENPEMICSDSFYCNWTNNPQMWEIEWWNREYVDQFDHFKTNDPWWDLESYMNWEANGDSWNNRNWIVAQGEGLFKHVDPTKF
jgi:hypothetical protein